MMPFEQGGWGWIFMWIFLLLPMGFSVIIGTLIWISENLKEFASEEEDVKKVETDFKAKLSGSTDEGTESLDSTKQPLTKEQEFTSILGDMKIHEKYKK